MSDENSADPFVVYTDEGHKQIRKGKYVYMIYKNARKDFKFKHKSVNDYNQHLCGGWFVYDHPKFEEVDRVASGLKPVGISCSRDKSLTEAKKEELLLQGIFATTHTYNNLYFVTASPYGTLQEYFGDLDILADDYEKHNLKYCARDIRKYRDINFSEFHNDKFDIEHHPQCITGLILGYPIENTMYLMLRRWDDCFDFENFNKQSLDEDRNINDHYDEDHNCDCNCNDCYQDDYDEHLADALEDGEEECFCFGCSSYRQKAHLTDQNLHENCDICEKYLKYIEMYILS